MIGVSVSLWSANLLNIERDIKMVDSIADKYHLDIMDNHYVNNLLFGVDFVKAVRGVTQRPIEVHLMVYNAEETIGDYLQAGANIIIIHLDTLKFIDTVIHRIKSSGCKIGIALRVEEDIKIVLPYLGKIDIIVIMGTLIGIKGAAFEEVNYCKIAELSKLIKNKKLSLEIQVDGGIRYETVPQMVENGARIITAGSILFNDIEKFNAWRENM